MNDFYTRDLFLIVVSIWGLVAWFLLSRLYAKYRVFQQLHGDIPYDDGTKKADKQIEGLAEESIKIFQEKFAEIKNNSILNYKTWNKQKQEDYD